VAEFNLNNSPISYIAVEGVIGAGKTSVATALAERLKAKLILEKFNINPYLEKFYDDPRVYAFRTQIFFLLERYTQLQELNQKGLFENFIISDYIFEKDKIFAYVNLNDEELKLYDLISLTLDRNIVSPDLVIYLQSPVEKLIKNIKTRNRQVEKNIKDEYIENLNDAYNYFFSRYKNSRVMVVNCEEADFINNQADFENLVTEIFNEDKVAVVYYNPSLRKTAL
jgi:deoxyadenosine/deoxycytidine kinase